MPKPILKIAWDEDEDEMLSNFEKEEWIRQFKSNIRPIAEEVLRTLRSEKPFQLNGWNELQEYTRSRGELNTFSTKYRTIYYIGKVYKKNNEYTKTFTFTCGNIVELDIMKEIILQKYATTLQVKCDFDVPEISQYGKYTDNDTCIIYFTMTEMPYASIKNNKDFFLDNKETCRQLSNKINEITRCLSNNNLIHNDLNNGNIFYDIDSKKVGIIDYGKASNNNETISSRDNEFTCNTNITGEGGNRKGKRKGKRKTYKRKTYKRKTYKRK
jgi:serine/threonine protein kinase